MSQYTPTPTNRNKAIENVSLTDVLLEHSRTINLRLNCHAVGKIQSFDATRQTCTATINYQKTYVARNSDGTYSEKKQDYPVLVDVPVIILSGGTASLTFPIQAGDDCLILFHDRDLDNWITSGQVLPPNSTRAHDLNDGIALVGLRHFKNSLAGYDTTRAKLQNGDAYVGVSTTKIKVANNSTTLNTQLQDLCTKLQNLCSAIQAITVSGVTAGPGISGPPVNAATFATISSQLGTIATSLGGLIE